LCRYTSLISAATDLHKLVEQFGVATIDFELCVTIREARVGGARAHYQVEFHAAKIFERCACFSGRRARAAPVLSGDRYLLL
jgi:hypothetical protein